MGSVYIRRRINILARGKRMNHSAEQEMFKLLGTVDQVGNRSD